MRRAESLRRLTPRPQAYRRQPRARQRDAHLRHQRPTRRRASTPPCVCVHALATLESGTFDEAARARVSGADQHGNIAWCREMSATAFQRDVLLVAGDVGDTMNAVKQGLRELKAKFRRVLFTPGNHCLWARARARARNACARGGGGVERRTRAPRGAAGATRHDRRRRVRGQRVQAAVHDRRAGGGGRGDGARHCGDGPARGAHTHTHTHAMRTQCARARRGLGRSNNSMHAVLFARRFRSIAGTTPRLMRATRGRAACATTSSPPGPCPTATCGS